MNGTGGGSTEQHPQPSAVVNAKEMQVLNAGGAEAAVPTNGSGSAAAPATAVPSSSSTAGGPPPIKAPDSEAAAAVSSGGDGGTTPSATTAASTAAAAPSNRRGSATRSPRPSPRPKKRQRSSASPVPVPLHTTVRNSDDEENSAEGGGANPDGSSNSSSSNQQQHHQPPDAFYLRHQNRALASELRSYKRQIDVLVAERDYRRDRCDEARVEVDRLNEIWCDVEGYVKTGLIALNVPGAGGVPAVKTEQNNGDGGGGGSGGSSAGGAGAGDITGGNTTSTTSGPIPPSTGAGENVETVPALVASLVRLADVPSLLPTPVKGGVDDDGENENGDIKAEEEDEEKLEAAYVKADLTDISRSASSIASRADALRSSLVQLLRTALSSASASVEQLSAADPLLEPAALRRDIAALQNQLGEKDSRMAELTLARDEASRGEKRVRRGLYRLASGRMKLTDVVKAVEMEDGSALFEEFAKEEAAMTASTLSSPVAAASSSVAPVSVTGADDGPVDSAEVGQLRKRLQDVEEVADSRENRISGLLMEREDYIKQINDLHLAKADTHSEPISVDDVKRSDLYTETAKKLAKVEAHTAQLQKAFDDVNQRWAKAKGDLDLAHKTIKEMEDTHVKRMEEISATGNISSDKEGAADTSDGQCNGDADEKSYISDAKRIVELEHKLNQALENVRQAETVRESLAEANRINETISAKLDEYQAKNSALIQAKGAARAAELEAGTAASNQTVENDKVVEKLQKEHRKMRKELSNALLSKDNARAKQERAERERDALMKTNARLLAQSAEKDEMNARSLSTILHLNQLSEQLSQEKEILEQKAKAAEQLSLSARLASNAKERCEEEKEKEKESEEKEAAEAKERIDEVIAEKEDVKGKLGQSQAQIASVVKDLNVAKSRCNELAKESTAAEEEKSRLMESLAVAKKEAAEAKKQAADACAHMASVGGRKGGVNSEFTMEQMETQVKVLKGRLACNVCNERDKEVILLRCRHMFCRPCVDKNIKNRSRKCPGCGQRFDMKDVGDVWL